MLSHRGVGATAAMPSSTSRLFTWLNSWTADERSGTLVDIFVTTAAGRPMRRVDACRCVAGQGIEGDRYASGAGHWRSVDGCQLTLVAREALEQAGRRGPVSFTEGQHRRNLVVAGIPIQAYRGRDVRIGDVVLRFQRLRPPCAYLDRLLGPGAGKALGKAGGIGLRVICGGTIRVGDRVEVLEDVGDRSGQPGSR